MTTIEPTTILRVPSRRAIAMTILAFVVLLGLAALIDQPAARWAAQRSPGLVRAAWLVSDAGRSGGLLAISAIVATWAYLGRGTIWGRARWGALTLLGDRALLFFSTIALAGIVAQLLKHLVGRVRPTVMPDAGVFNFHPLSWKNSLASFPSGHTTSAFAAALTLGLMIPRLRWLFYSVAVVIALSRIVVGAHYPSDLVGGAALGTLVALAVARAFARGNVMVGPPGR